MARNNILYQKRQKESSYLDSKHFLFIKTVLYKENEILQFLTLNLKLIMNKKNYYLFIEFHSFFIKQR